MKLTFHPKRFAQVILAITALTFTQCNKPVADTSAGSAPTTKSAGASGNSIAIVGEGASPSFRAVASKLELGGRSFEYSEADAVPALVKFFDEILKAVPEQERKGIPPGFTFAKLANLLGLDAIAAIGSSSRARADGSFHARSFAYMPQGRKGMITLSGGPSAKLMLLDFAPKDTDLALEFPIHFNEFARNVLPGILEMIPPSERTGFEHEMSQPVPPLGLTGKQIIEKLDARVGIFLRLDPTQKFQPAPNAPEFPGADGVIVIERLGWLVEALKPQFMPALKDPGAPVAVTDEGGVLTVRFKGPAGPPPMDYQPVLQFDSKADRILIASRTALFDSVLAGKEKITQGADFTQAWRDFPSEGNACIYASSRLLQTIGNLISTAAQSERGASPADRALVGRIFEWVKPLLNRGQAVLLANQADGILVTGNTSIPAGGSTVAGISSVAVVAALALPAYARLRVQGVERARHAEEGATRATDERR